MTESAPKLFISYRREETPSHAGRLYDKLAAQFGERNVFMDIELEPGIDFVDRVVEVVGACQVFLVVVGPTWATLSNGGSRPRLADREDYVRLEVETALRRRNVRVIPLLVAGARMPHSHELPEELRSLTRRNALELSDVRWRSDVDRLLATLEGLLETGTVPVLAGTKAIEAPRAPAAVKAGTIEGSRPEAKVGAEIVGHRLEAIIGQSRTGCVYRARDLQLDRVVALKVIAPEFAEDPEFRQRFKRESRQAASIRHPNVVSIYRAGEQGDLLFLTRDYVEGINLKTFIGIRGRLEPGLAARIASQVAAGLEAGHARGLVHRDVTPGNVLIDAQEQAYLTNFGLAKRAGAGSALTKPDLVVGTTDYLAPEQIRGDKLDARVDVYALGCVLYEALTGSVPYPRESPAATMRAHISDTPPSVRDGAPDVPLEFDTVVRRAMAKEPNQRFISAEAMRREIDAAARGKTLPGRVTAPAADDVAASVPSGDAPAAGVVPPPSAPMADSPTASPQPPAPAPAAGDARPPSSAPPAGPAAAVPAHRQSPRRERRSPRILLALAVVGLVVVAAVAVLLAGGGDDDGPGSQPAAVPPATKLPTNLAWQRVAELPFRRQYAASTEVNGKVWVVGGIRTNSSSSATKIYDPASHRWSTGAGPPLPLHHFSAVNWDGEAVVLGGFVPDGNDLTAGQSNRVFALHESTSPDELPPFKHKRGAAAAAVVGDKIVVVGGQADGKLVPQTEVFDGERWTDATEMPTLREHLGAASDGHYLYAVGGRDPSTGATSAAFERYDPESDTWTRLDAVPEAVGSAGVGVGYAGGRIVVVGGEGTTAVSDAVYGYDIRGRQWKKLPALPTPRHGAAVTAIKDSLYAIGGATAAGHAGPTNDVELLDLSGEAAAPVTVNLKWSKAVPAPLDVQYAATAVVGGKIWLFGGIGEDETAIAESVAYDPTIRAWTSARRLPTPVDHAAAVNYGDTPVVIGGDLAGGGPASASDRVYAMRGGKWEKWPRLNHKRWAPAAAVVGDKIVVVGGQAGGRLVRATEVFDGHRWTDAPPIPTPRDHLGAASDDQYVYAVGGRKGSSATNLGALERYDPATHRWTELDPMPQITGAVGVAYLSGRIVAVGGESLTTVSDAVQAYDVRTQAWRPLTDLPEARHGVAVAALGRSLFAIGGAAEAGHFHSTRDTYRLDLG